MCGLAAVSDVYYRVTVGFDEGLDALLSPTHLLMLVAGAVMVSGPLSNALHERSRRAGWPVIISAGLTLSVFTCLTLYISPVFTGPFRDSAPATNQLEVKILGAVSILVQTFALVMAMLTLVRSFELPRGTMTMLCALNGLFMFAVSHRFELYPILLLTGIAADGLLLVLAGRVKPATSRMVLAAAVPATYTLLYWGATVLFKGGNYWEQELWVGTMINAAIGGWTASVLLGPARWKSVHMFAADDGEEPAGRISPQAVKAALEKLENADALSASPLTAQLPHDSDAASSGAAAVRRLLTEIVEELAGAADDRDAEAGQLLFDYYVRRIGSQEVIAERLRLSRPTFYRRQQRGLARVAERLDERANTRRNGTSDQPPERSHRVS